MLMAKNCRTLRAASAKPDAASATLSRVGQYAFWLLVVVIVSVRILMYPAAPTFEVGSTTATKQTVTR